jgi:hypothetical protein
MKDVKERALMTVKLISLIPEYIMPTNQIDKPRRNNSQDYTEENCKEFNVPYIKEFVDLDTFVSEKGDRFRIQGYIKVDIDTLMELNVEDLQYLINIVMTKDTLFSYNDDGSIRLEISNSTHYK